MELRTEAINRVLEALAPALDAELGRATEEARHSTREQVTTELERHFSQKLEEATELIRAESLKAIEESAAAWLQEKAALQLQIDEWRLFANAQRQLAEAGSQPEMLLRFLKLAERFAASIAVYVMKADGLAIWKSRGEASAFPSVLSPEAIQPEFYFQQIIIRETVVAAVCAEPPYNAEALVFLTECLHRAIELFGLRLSSLERDSS